MYVIDVLVDATSGWSLALQEFDLTFKSDVVDRKATVGAGAKQTTLVVVCCIFMLSK